MSSAPSSVMRPLLNVRVAQDASAHLPARFVYGHVDAMLAKPPGCHQAGQAAAHHGDATHPLQLLAALRALESQIPHSLGTFGIAQRTGLRGARELDHVRPRSDSRPVLTDQCRMMVSIASLGQPEIPEWQNLRDRVRPAMDLLSNSSSCFMLWFASPKSAMKPGVKRA